MLAGESNQKGLSSSHQTNPEIQPTFTLEPQKPTPSQNKVVPSNIFVSCLRQSEHSSLFPSLQAGSSSNQSLSASQTVLTSSVPTSSSSGRQHASHIIQPNRTQPDALVFQNSSGAVLQQGQFSSASPVTMRELNHHLPATPSGEVQYRCVPYNPPRVTTEESEELVKLVEESPHLKTAKNRFKNQKPPRIA